jgi:Bacterial Ig-like domain (group 3)/FG-GAP-like repeat
MKIVALTVLAIGLSIPAHAAGIFRNPLPIPIGTNGFSDLQRADFNGDHHDDVLIVNPAGELSVLIANGTGPFAAPAITPIPDFATDLPGIGDVNEDGRNDVVVSDWPTRTIGVLLGNGDGTFVLGDSFASSDLVGPIALGTFNGDGHLDLAIGTPDTHSGENTITIYFGDGAGHFSGSVVTSTEWDEVQRLTTVDMNLDGKSDLIVGNWSGNRIFLGDGQGGFTKKSATADGDVIVHDFDHDGKPDVAVAAGGTHEWFIEVFRGNGDGTVGTSVRYPAGYSSESMDSADIDGDGNLDLLAAGTAGSTVTVLRGKADGTFHAPELWLSGPSSWRIVVDDFDRDGKFDFLTGDYNSEIWSLSFVRGNGDGTFRTDRAFHTGSVVPVLWPGLRSRGGVIADMNNDDKEDVVIIQEHPNTFPTDLGVLLNDGTGKLAFPILTDTGYQRWNGLPPFAIGDLNNDGKRDAVVLNNLGYTPTAKTFLGNGDGTFASAIPLQVSSYNQPILGHFNGDTNLDMLFTGSYSVSLYPGQGNGTFGAGIPSDVQGQDVLIGDLNGDGKLDFVSSAIRAINVGLNDGNGHFTSLPVTSEEITTAALADFDGDHKLDLLLTTYVGVETRFGNGNGTFGPPVPFTIRPVPNYPWRGPTTTADFDGDGKVDIIFETSVYLSNGDGTFRTRARFRTNGVTAISIADMDRDGSPDVVVQKESADDVDVLLTNKAPDPNRTSSISLSTDTTTAGYAQDVVFTATVTGGVIPLGGVVAFAADDHPVALIAIDAQGKATFTTAFARGSHHVTATYTGDENYLPSTDSVSLSVTKATTTVTIDGFPNPQPAGQTVTIYVQHIAGYQYGFQAPTGALTLRDGDTPLNVTITNNLVKIKTLAVGSHEISVDYAGDENYEGSTATYTQVITNPVPYLDLQITPGVPILAGTPVQFHAFFHGANVTGTVSFYIDDVLHSTVPIVNAVADRQLSFTWGSHTVKARYSGDSSWGETSASRYYTVLIGPWGTPLAINAMAYGAGSVTVYWSQIAGGVSYTVWRKKSLLDAWEAVVTYPSGVDGTSIGAVANTTSLFAVTATDANGNVTPMSPPDLATSVFFTDFNLVPRETSIKAQHILDLRTAIASARTFAGLSSYSYSNSILAGQKIRAADIQELRTALAQARAAIGLPAVSFTDSTLTPSASVIRAAHITELRSGVN